MKRRILATSSEGEGLLPMKRGEEQEAKKSQIQQAIEDCNFVKNAFCVSGEVKMIGGEKCPTTIVWFECEDARRGKFWVAYGESKP